MNYIFVIGIKIESNGIGLDTGKNKYPGMKYIYEFDLESILSQSMNKYFITHSEIHHITLQTSENLAYDY